MLDAINQQRQQSDLPFTTLDHRLTEIARARSLDMATNNYFGHTTPDGSTVFPMLRARDINTATACELLGRTNGPDDQSVGLIVTGFINSPNHGIHLLSEKYNLIGVGIATGESNMKYCTIILLGG